MVNIVIIVQLTVIIVRFMSTNGVKTLTCGTIFPLLFPGT